MIFISLFNISQIKERLLIPILSSFGTIETKSCEMLHLYHLVWLKSILHLATLQMQTWSNNEFCQKLLLFLKHIIKYLAS